MEIGVDILNPIEPAVKGMDPAILKASFGERLTFHGGISQQQVLSKGTPDQVKEEVKQRIRELGCGGGYILAAAQTIVPEVPAENIVEMFRAARQYGTYPLSEQSGGGSLDLFVSKKLLQKNVRRHGMNKGDSHEYHLYNLCSACSRFGGGSRLSDQGHNDYQPNGSGRRP